MATYYETLQVQPTATPAEVDDACNTLYNKWRRLVTHHDPSVVNQANQALQQVDAIRSTLSDPVRRSAYDEGIGLNGAIGGLADPEAVLRAMPVVTMAPPSPPPPRPLAGPPAQVAASRPGLWACPKKGCGAENPPNTKFCFKCGTQLVQECPECKKMSSLISTSFCGECGYRYSIASERAATLAAWLELQQNVERQNGELGMLQEQRNHMKYGGHIFWMIVFGLGALGVFLGAHSDYEKGGAVGVSVSVSVSVVLGAFLVGIVVLIGGGDSSKQKEKAKADAAIVAKRSEIERTTQMMAGSAQVYQQLGQRKAG